MCMFACLVLGTTTYCKSLVELSLINPHSLLILKQEVLLIIICTCKFEYISCVSQVAHLERSGHYLTVKDNQVREGVGKNSAPKFCIFKWNGTEGG